MFQTDRISVTIPGMSTETSTDTTRHKADLRADRAAEVAAQHEAAAAKQTERGKRVAP